MSKFLKDPDIIPYWSPATQHESNTSSLSQFAVSAKEFVPSRFSSEETYNTKGLNSTANEWVPSKSTIAEYTVDNNSMEANTSSNDELVEVLWNGTTVFVPESLAIEIEGLPQTSDTFGMDWALAFSSLPTPPKRSLQTIGIPEPIRQHFQGLDLTSLRQMDPADERYKEIPVRYHSCFPLDDPSAQRRAGGSFGYPSCLYKATDRADSHVYALRRFDNVRLVSASVLKSAQTKWTAVRHPSIVTLYSISVEKGAIFFAHAYHPSAQTLKQRFLDSRAASAAQQGAVSESLLWRLLAQISAGVRLVHSRGLAVRALSPSHILLTSGARFRIANVGVADVLEFESRKALQDLQAEDMLKLGCIVLSVATRRLVTPKSVEAAMNHLQQNFSQDLCRTVAALLTGSRTIEQIMFLMMSDKLCDELDFALASSDALHLNLRGEYENGRMLRLLLKLGLVNERPEYALAPAWSETGERYLLQLFRDYLFHQADTDGAPQLDMGHVISALNKLDTGDQEQILLSSRNGKDLLVASFSDVRRCLEMSIADLLHQSQRASSVNTTSTHPTAQHPSSRGTGPNASRLGSGGLSVATTSTSRPVPSVPSGMLKDPQYNPRTVSHAHTHQQYSPVDQQHGYSSIHPQAREFHLQHQHQQYGAGGNPHHIMQQQHQSHLQGDGGRGGYSPGESYGSSLR